MSKLQWNAVLQCIPLPLLDFEAGHLGGAWVGTGMASPRFGIGCENEPSEQGWWISSPKGHWLRLMLTTWSRRVQVPPVSGNFSLSLYFTSMPWSSLSSTPSNEEVFHHIFQRGCKAVSPEGPGSISLRLFQALLSHYYSRKLEGVITHILVLNLGW